MSNEVLSDLTLRIRANTAELKSGLDKAGSQVNRFSKDSKKSGDQVSKSFAGIKNAFANMASGLTGKLEGITGGLGEMGSSIGPIISGVKGLTAGMNIFKVALASTGIGLVVVALGALVAYLTTTQEGMDMLNQVLEPLKAGFGALMGVLQNVGKFIFDNFIPVFKGLGDIMMGVASLMTGNVSGALEKFKSGMDGLGNAFGNAKKLAAESTKAMKESIGVGSQIAALEKEIALAEINRATNRNKLKRQLKEYNDLAEDTSRTEGERIEAARKSIELTKQIKALDESVINLQLKKLKLQQSLNDTSDADKLEYAKKQADLEMQIAESVEMHTTQRNKLNILLGAQAKSQQALNDQRAIELKQLENSKVLDIEVKGKGIELPKFDLPKIELDIKPVEPAKIIAPFEVALMRIKDIGAKMSEAIGKASETISTVWGGITSAMGAGIEKRSVELDNYYNQEATRLEQSQMSSEAKEEALIALEKKTAAERAKIAKKQAKMDKASAIMSAIMNTALGVTKAIAQGGVAGIVTGAIVAAAGAVQVGTIASTPLPTFANGGTMKESGMALVGERGPELVSMAKGMRVASHEQSKNMLGGAQTVQVNIKGVIEGQTIRLVLDETDRRNGINF